MKMTGRRKGRLFIPQLPSLGRTGLLLPLQRQPSSLMFTGCARTAPKPPSQSCVPISALLDAQDYFCFLWSPPPGGPATAGAVPWKLTGAMNFPLTIGAFRALIYIQIPRTNIVDLGATPSIREYVSGPILKRLQL